MIVKLYHLIRNNALTAGTTREEFWITHVLHQDAMLDKLLQRLDCVKLAHKVHTLIPCKEIVFIKQSNVKQINRFCHLMEEHVKHV